MHEFKTGIFHWYGYILPLEERIEQIKQAGFDYVMLWWEDEVYPYTISKMEFINIINNYDLKLDNVHFRLKILIIFGMKAVHKETIILI